MRKYNNPDCCPCQSGCTKFCVTVVGYGDQVVSGLPLTYSGTKDGSPWTYDAVTDSEGKYCYTVTGTEKPKSVTVHGDCDSGAVFYYDPGGVDTCSVTFTYCSFRIVFSVNPEAAPTITSLPNLFATETRNEAGDEVTWSWCQLSTGFANTYPKSVTFTATTYDARGVNYGPNPLYPPLCKSLTINCGHDYTLDLVQSYFGDCYYGFNSCDKGCDKGVGPYQRGLISKTMEVRFSSIDNRFAADEGSWISLPGSLIYNTAGGAAGGRTDWSLVGLGGEGRTKPFPISRFQLRVCALRMLSEQPGSLRADAHQLRRDEHPIVLESDHLPENQRHRQQCEMFEYYSAFLQHSERKFLWLLLGF